MHLDFFSSPRQDLTSCGSKKPSLCAPYSPSALPRLLLALLLALSGTLKNARTDSDRWLIELFKVSVCTVQYLVQIPVAPNSYIRKLRWNMGWRGRLRLGFQPLLTKIFFFGKTWGGPDWVLLESPPKPSHRVLRTPSVSATASQGSGAGYKNKRSLKKKN